MITSQHIILFILCFAILQYMFEPQHANMKGLLYLKQLFDERCRINRFNAKNVSGYLSFITMHMSYFKTFYYRFNNVNVTACQDINLSAPGKPSAQLISAMSHLFKENSTAKYFTKSPLANELFIESILAKDIFAGPLAIINTDYIWTYLPLGFLIMYPFVHECALSSYHSIEDYLFDSGSTRISNHVFIHESATENETTKAPAPKEPTTTTHTTSRRSSLASSIGSIHLDYTNAAAHNWTGEELLAEESKPRPPVKAPFELSKSQRFWSDSQPANSDPFAFSDSQSGSSRNAGSENRFQFPIVSGPSNVGNFQTQHGAPDNHNTATDPEPHKPSEKLVYLPESGSSTFSSFSEMLFVPPTSSVTERLPEFTKDDAPNPPLNLPAAFADHTNVASISSSTVSIILVGPSKPSVVSTPSKHTQTAGPSGVIQKPPENKDSFSFDGHTTPPEHPKFARRPFSHFDKLTDFASQKQSINDFADQLGAFLERVASNEVCKCSTASDSKNQPSTTGVKPPAALLNNVPSHIQSPAKQTPKKQPFNDAADLAEAQGGESFSREKMQSKRDSKPNLAQPNPLNSRADVPPPPQSSATSTDIGPSLTEDSANVPFMPRRKNQPTASTTVKLPFSRFKTGTDGAPTGSSSLPGPSLPPQNQPSYTADLSGPSIPPSSSPTTDNNKKQDSPRPARSSFFSSKPRYSYFPGSLHSPAVSVSQTKGYSLFTSSFKHLRCPSGIRTFAYVSARTNRDTPSSNIEITMDATSSTAPMASITACPNPSTVPSSMTANQSASSIDHASLETELTLNLSDENFFTTALVTATSLNPDLSSNVPPTNSNNMDGI